MTEPWFPAILSSDLQRLYVLKVSLSDDVLDFASSGSAALLWIALHLTDPKPWTAGRNPLYMNGNPGFIDSEAKRILGKRFQFNALLPKVGHVELDPFPIVLQTCDRANHDFSSPTLEWPEFEKVPGKLLPRRLTAHAEVETNRGHLDLYSRNFTEISQCLHAELTLLFALSRRLSEARANLKNFRLKTTLKPCRMCAAFLHSLKSHTSFFQVTYEEDDPGPLATNTLLDQFGYQSERSN